MVEVVSHIATELFVRLLGPPALHDVSSLGEAVIVLGEGYLGHAGGERPIAVLSEAFDSELGLVSDFGVGPEVDVVIEHGEGGSFLRLGLKGQDVDG
jgi:hypothetical protein